MNKLGGCIFERLSILKASTRSCTWKPSKIFLTRLFLNKEIAVRLGITEHTVSNYLFRIYNKLGISTRVELVLHIMKQREEHVTAS